MWLVFVHQAFDGEDAAAKVRDLRLAVGSIRPLRQGLCFGFAIISEWLITRFSPFRQWMFFGRLGFCFWLCDREWHQLSCSVELSCHRLIHELQMSCRCQVDVLRRDAHQVEDGCAVDCQNARLVTEDFAPRFPWFFFGRDNLFCATQNTGRDFKVVKIHRKQGAGDLQIEGIQGVMRAFAAVSYISTIGIGACVSALYVADAVAGDPFARQDPAVNVLGAEPRFEELDDDRQLCAFSINWEDGFHSTDHFPDVGLMCFLEAINIFGGQNKVLHVAVVHIQFELQNSFLLLFIDVVEILFVRDELRQKTLTERQGGDGRQYRKFALAELSYRITNRFGTICINNAFASFDIHAIDDSGVGTLNNFFVWMRLLRSAGNHIPGSLVLGQFVAFAPSVINHAFFR